MKKLYFLKAFVIGFFTIALSLFLSNCESDLNEEIEKKTVTVKLGEKLVVAKVKFGKGSYASFSFSDKDKEAEMVKKAKEEGFKGSAFEKFVLYSDKETTKVFFGKIDEDMTLYAKFGWKVEIKYNFGDEDKVYEGADFIIADGKKIETSGRAGYYKGWDKFISEGLLHLRESAKKSKKELADAPFVTEKDGSTSAKDSVITKDGTVWVKTK